MGKLPTQRPRPSNVDKKGGAAPDAEAENQGPADATDDDFRIEALPGLEIAGAGKGAMPTRLADPGRRRDGPSGPDPERARQLREARKRALSARAQAQGADPGRDSKASPRGGMRSAATQDQYLKRGRMLLNRYRRENRLGSGMDDVNPVEFVNWLLSMKPHCKASTWRYYRQSASSTISGLPHHETEAALAILDADVVESAGEKKPGKAKTRQGFPRRTSALKEKRFPKAEFDMVGNYLRDFTRSRMAHVLLDWMTAGVVTGLRPIEWRATELEVQDDPTAMRGRRAWLYVLNAKATNGRGNGAVRTLDLSNVSDEALQAVSDMSERGAKWLLEGQYDVMQSQCSQLLYTVCDRIFPSRTRFYSLYSLRHQFIANMKSVMRPEEVSALAGHVVTTTASENYGRRQSSWPPEAIVDIPAPVSEEVSTVRQRLKFFEERMRMRVEAGLPPLPGTKAKTAKKPRPAEGDGDPGAAV